MKAIFAVILVLMLVACQQGMEAPPAIDPAPVCTLSLIDGRCCDDTNENSVCDDDETFAKLPDKEPEKTRDADDADDAEEIAGAEEIKTSLVTVKNGMDTHVKLWLNANGGPSNEDLFFDITNSGDETVLLRIICIDEELEANNVDCGDTVAGQVEAGETERQEVIFSSTLRTVTLSGTVPDSQTKLGTFNGELEFRLYPANSIYIDVDNDKVDYEVLKKEPFKVTVHCAAGCCDSGEYKGNDCSK